MRKIQVVAGIVWKDGCFLAARRSPGKRGEGFWEFPGGKIEPDETREQALARELSEDQLRNLMLGARVLKTSRQEITAFAAFAALEGQMLPFSVT